MAPQPEASFSDEVDERYNNLVAAGALLATLTIGQPHALSAVNLVLDRDYNATNQLDIEFRFLKSAYRVTVERLPG